MLTVTSPKDKPLAGLGGQPLPGHRGEDRRPRRDDRRRRGHRARPQRDGRLLGGRGRHRRRRSATAGSTPAISAASTRRATSTSSGARRTSSSTPTARTSTPTRSRTSTATRPTSRSCRWWACPTASPSTSPAPSSPNYEHDAGAVARRGRRRKIEEHFREGLGRPAVLEAREGDPHLGGRPAADGEAQVKRRDVVAELQRRQRKKTRSPGDAGRAPRARGGVGWLLEIVATVSAASRAPSVHLRQPGRRARLRQPDVHRAGARRSRRAGVDAARELDFTGAATSPTCTSWSRAAARRRPAARASRGRAARRASDEDSTCPTSVAARASAGLGAGAAPASTSACSSTEVDGAAHIPQHTHFIVAANHALHLDMGRDQGGARRGGARPRLAGGGRLLLREQVPAGLLRATSPTSCRWSGTARSASRWRSPSEVLRRGRSMVRVPRGHALADGRDGRLPAQPRLPGAAGGGGHPAGARLAARYEALPKGAAIPRARDLRSPSVRSCRIELLKRRSRGCPQQEALAPRGGAHPADRRGPARRRGDPPRRRGGARGLGRPGARRRRRAPAQPSRRPQLRCRSGPPSAACSATVIGMKTLVTGATGFLGTHLVDELWPRVGDAAPRPRARHSPPPALAARRGVEIVPRLGHARAEDVAARARGREPRLSPRRPGLAQARGRAPHVRGPRRRHAPCCCEAAPRRA